ncbi:hypothetical protein KUV51_21635 [Tateyamaria omphalii]|uniref:hypothetical protein n=1 Tax=Tateyamaria omphalii TaxID=299262 RepID=UPI001C99816F|nr:hypothetical protein [Tateyamaria omphalii]MBY5935626.1 hypothetical protein [Tateyamaria omphalii]
MQTRDQILMLNKGKGWLGRVAWLCSVISDKNSRLYGQGQAAMRFAPPQVIRT